jgi:hypothetical protein
LEYDLEGHHLGLVAAGPGAAEAVRRLAAPIQCRFLLAQREEDIVWAWLGRWRPLDPDDVRALILECRLVDIAFACGEPSTGLAGWRLSHRQAVAALPIARAHRGEMARYADFAVLVSALQDDLLVTSLREMYIDPLSDRPDGGSILRKTLAAYVSAEYHMSSAAAALGVNRQTVAKRLHLIEERLGEHQHLNSPEMQTALRLEELNRKTHMMSS